MVKVSGLLDPVLADFIEQSIDQAEERNAAGVVFWMNSADTVVPDERVAELVERVRTRRRAGRHLGGPVAGPGPGGRRAAGRGRRRGEHRAAQPDRRLRRPGGVARPLHARRTGRPSIASATARSTPRPPRSSASSRRRRPTSATSSSASTGWRRPRSSDRRRARAERRRAWCSGRCRSAAGSCTRWPALRSPTCSSSSAWPSSCSSCSPPGSAWPAWWAPGPSCSVRYGLAVLPDPAVRGRPARAVDGRLRHRRPDRRAPGVDRHRRRRPRGRFLPALRRGVDVVDHAAGRDRRRAPVHAGRHAGHGPHPVLHPDDRAGLDDRRGGRGRGRGRIRTAWSRSAARCGGPGPTGRRPSRPATPYVWSRSTVCCSRSSPSKGRPRTTATDENRC